MPDLKLLAFDSDDLQVVSANLQDAVLRVGDMAYLKRDRRFALLANRFDWVASAGAGHGSVTYERRRSALRIERVLDAKVSGIDLAAGDVCLELLALSFELGEVPSGVISLHFAGGAGIRLQVECIEVALQDLGAAWATGVKPHHEELKGTPPQG